MPANTKASKLNVISETMFFKVENKMTRPNITYFSNCFQIILQQILPFTYYNVSAQKLNYVYLPGIQILEQYIFLVFIHVSVFPY